MAHNLWVNELERPIVIFDLMTTRPFYPIIKFNSPITNRLFKIKLNFCTQFIKRFDYCDSNQKDAHT